jgi:thymidylate synthase
MMAQDTGLTPGFFVHTLGDAHIYSNHIEGLREQLLRTPRPLPRVTLADRPMDEMRFEDIVLTEYAHHPFIRFKVAV